MIQACFSIRPGTLIGISGIVYKVTSNSTLDRVIELRQMTPPHTTKRIHYAPGQEVHIRWKPENRI